METHHHRVDPGIPLRLEEMLPLLDEHIRVELSENALQKIAAGRAFLEEKMQSAPGPVYGINTGFGALYNTAIGADDLEKLQENLVKSHACGMGDEVPMPIVRLMLYLKVRGLSYGLSGVQVSTAQRLLDFLNLGIYPVVYEQGSLGASGDLAPLAHLCLPLLGLGEVRYKGIKMPAADALTEAGLQKISLQSKEGLALLNGTQFMSSYAVHHLLHFRRLFAWANAIAALSLDAYDGRIEPFDERLHQARPHRGQIEIAAAFRRLLQGSEMISRNKAHVQDPYSFRCIPQVHGASWDAMLHVEHIVTTEINSVTDNPTLFPEDGSIISGGNFHGQPLAINLDYLAIAAHELGSISERRIYQLVNGHRGLPGFLTPEPGLNSGFMIAQYTAASIVSQSKQLCMPNSVDTIDSSKGQEDHVSMGANAATKTYRVMNNLERVLAIELLTAAQAFQFRRPTRSSALLETLLEHFRSEVPFIENDVLMADYMHRSVSFIRNNLPETGTSA